MGTLFMDITQKPQRSGPNLIPDDPIADPIAGTIAKNPNIFPSVHTAIHMDNPIADMDNTRSVTILSIQGKLIVGTFITPPTICPTNVLQPVTEQDPSVHDTNTCLSSSTELTVLHLVNNTKHSSQQPTTQFKCDVINDVIHELHLDTQPLDMSHVNREHDITNSE